MLAGRREPSRSAQSEAASSMSPCGYTGRARGNAGRAEPDAGEALPDIHGARARHYALLATLLMRAPDRDLLDQIASLKGDGTPLGLGRAALAEAARNCRLETIEQEYFELFIGIGRGELMPYGSYYMTGFLYERPLARLRGDLAALGIARAEGHCEPEDHIGTLCEVMAGLAGGRFPAPPGSDEQIFKRHLEPWARQFFADLEHAPAVQFYRSVGALGRVFIDIETEAFALPA